MLPVDIAVSELGDGGEVVLTPPAVALAWMVGLAEVGAA
jgi:hypothetical protein